MLSSATLPVASRRLAPAGAAPGFSTPLGLGLFVALFAIPMLAALRPAAERPINDPDVWWHLRAGQWIVEHGTVPDHDPFAVGHQPWVAYSWLFEVGLYGLYSTFGLASVLIYRVVGALGVVAVLYRLVRRREPDFVRAVVLCAAAALATAAVFSERPWLFTIAFTVLTIDVVLDLRAGRRTGLVWALPALYAVWANVHVQFIYGLGVLGLAVIAPLVDRLLHRELVAQRGWGKLVGLTTACALATLLSPYHVRLYGVVWEYASQPGPFRYVNELRALEFREVSDWTMLGLGAAGVFVLGRRQRLDTFRTLLLVAATFFSFRCRRDLWFLAAASLAVLADREADVPSRGRFRITAPRALAAVTLLAAILVVVVARCGLSNNRLRAGVAEGFPVQAAAVIADKRYNGPLFNDFTWGGYLIWALPELPVVLDGRTNLHGDERTLRIGAVWAGAPGWKDDPDLCAAGVVVADVQMPLAQLLLTDARFDCVHEDAVARVFVRRVSSRGH